MVEEEEEETGGRPASGDSGTTGGKPRSTGSTRKGSIPDTFGLDDAATGELFTGAGTAVFNGGCWAGSAGAGASLAAAAGTPDSRDSCTTDEPLGWTGDGMPTLTDAAALAGAATVDSGRELSAGTATDLASTTGISTGLISTRSSLTAEGAGFAAGAGTGSGLTGGNPSNTGSTRNGVPACAAASPAYPARRALAKPQHMKIASCLRRAVRFIRTLQSSQTCSRSRRRIQRGEW